MPNILFVCSANRFRSVLAAERFRHLLQERVSSDNWVVGSAGIWAKNGVAPIKEAIQLAQSEQLNIGDVRSREINAQLVTDADLILVMAENQKEAITVEFPQARKKTVLLSEAAIGQIFDVPDPVVSIGEYPEDIGKEIFSLVDAGFEKILSRFPS